ncbi:MAG: EVE domain-containing protein [Xanthomonadales bacterium]|jgi:predicted RNA-binding protein with PUA-like domain|nr:EVE domain-containing protein [Xanthomonadales bacterium]
MNHWLLKSEPDAFSIDDLASRPRGTAPWDGIRNYQARNYMRDGMRKGDLAFFYHSSCATPGIVGICEIVSGAYPDHTAFDPASKYFDADSDPGEPRWLMVDVKFRRRTRRLISLEEIKQHADRLEGFALIRRGNRLSIMPVDKPHWDLILALE